MEIAGALARHLQVVDLVHPLRPHRLSQRKSSKLYPWPSLAYQTLVLQIYTSSYDCTIRSLSMGSGISKEIFSSGDVLINSIDFDPAGRVMWISDAAGGITHFDTRMDRSRAIWYGLSGEKVGSVSVNPTRPHFLLTASNSRALRFIDSASILHGLMTWHSQDLGHTEAGWTF